MRRTFASVLLVGLTFASAAWLMMPTAKAETIIFTAQLLASNEVPPVAVAPSEAGANGFATVTLDVTRDSGGNITAATARFDVSISGMAANSSIILAHIHEGGATVNGPVRVDSGITPAAPIAAPLGAATFTRSNLTVAPALAQSIINNPGGFYFNVHTALSPNGVARGQLSRQQQTTPGITAPTLSEWGAILMTLLIIAACTFFLLGRARAVMATANADSSAPLDASLKAVDWKLLARVAFYIEAAIAIALFAIAPGVVDAIGALVAGLIVAFIAHLFAANARLR
ncbi:MAG TPA: CHRD domain-containing protein [Blastocatellia bacterium]|nr:CHRD domain-containing protein [Blastocatellia bacterium]